MSPDEAKQPLSPSESLARRYANRDAIRQWHMRERAQGAVKALERHGFSAAFVENKDEAREAVLGLIPDGATVGIGGSMTIREIGVLNVLEKKGHKLFDHWKPGLSAEELMVIRRAQLTCDVFLTSVNAMTAGGELVSCEGIGNRIAAMTFGPRKVIVVAGVNKLTSDIPAAMRRVKDVAAPQALSGMDLELPCQHTGSCQECDSPKRGCRVTLIMERKPSSTDITVILVGQSLGF